MNRGVSWFCKICLIPLIKNFLIKEVRGLKNIPQRNFILVANHQSHLDEIATGYICVPKRYHFIGQTDRYSGFTKLFLYILYFIAGVIHLNRKSQASKRKASKDAIKYLKKGDSLIVYPEGTRTRTGDMGKGKWGVAKIFLATAVPIMPVGIKGTSELLPPGGKLRIKKNIKINIGQPLYFKKELAMIKNLDEKSIEYQQIVQKITEEMMANIVFLKSELDLK